MLKSDKDMNIGEATKLRILELCNENMITVNKLATISGITQSTLSNIIVVGELSELVFKL